MRISDWSSDVCSSDLNSVSVDSAVFEAFATENARKIRGLEAPKACIEAVKAATELPIDQGQQQERALFAKLVAGAQSEALRHVFFAERAAAQIDGLPKAIALGSLGKVGVIGAGTLGGGISITYLAPGVTRHICEMAQDAP